MKHTESNKLVTEVKTVFIVKDDDLDRFIKDQYGVSNFCFVADEEARNDSQYGFDGIDGSESEKTPESKWDTKEWELFRSSDGTSGVTTRLLLQDLCNRGLIPAGDYVIAVCW